MSAGDWDIFGDLARLRRNLNRFSLDVRAGLRPDDPEQVWTPPVDIIEQGDALVLLVDLPGMKREDIGLMVDQDSLTIEGQRPGMDSGTGIRLERPAGRFRRSFRIGVPVNPSDVQAVYRDGVLQIIVPRVAPTEPVRLRVDVE